MSSLNLQLSAEEQEVVREALATYADTLQTIEHSAEQLARGDLARRSKAMRLRASELHIRLLRESTK